ncbi:hypothetical protein GOBAR_DD23941 [Gossypium barbadense]|nr:hypothetical protein GOBAR_DD23941 [Gossypium barbadense]
MLFGGFLELGSLHWGLATTFQLKTRRNKRLRGAVRSLESLQPHANPRSSYPGLSFTEDLICVLIGSWGRLGLAKYCAEIFGQISFLGINPSTRLYNAVIDALIKSNSLDLAYLKFQQMSADNCKPDRKVDDPFRLIETMKKRNVFPNEATVRSLIHGVFRCVAPRKAFELLIMFLEKEPMM